MLICEEVETAHDPAGLTALLADAPGTILLESQPGAAGDWRYSIVAAEPFQELRAYGRACEIRCGTERRVLDSNPWEVMKSLIEPCLESEDLSLPAGGCFGFWGYDLRFFLEPKLPRRWNSGPLPDCQLGFYSSLVVFDHLRHRCQVISTGLDSDGKRDPARARCEADRWRSRLDAKPRELDSRKAFARAASDGSASDGRSAGELKLKSSVSRAEFISAVNRAREYIRQGDIYQVNLSHALFAEWRADGWEFYQQLRTGSPAPFGAYLNAGDFQLASSSPEQFLRLSGSTVCTRPIKGTRARSEDPGEDERLARELASSAKEQAELLMITDLLRNDLGKVCDYGSVQVPELARLERFAQVQHLVSTVDGCLRANVSHLQALAACFPGGSITGAPKFRAMQIIDELENRPRGPYTGALGYIGFNGQSQFSILIRTAICSPGAVRFDVGAGIVADSDPMAEYLETLVKARGFALALGHGRFEHGPGSADIILTELSGT